MRVTVTAMGLRSVPNAAADVDRCRTPAPVAGGTTVRPRRIDPPTVPSGVAAAVVMFSAYRLPPLTANARSDPASMSNAASAPKSMRANVAALRI